jgi:hypothetical protein
MMRRMQLIIDLNEVVLEKVAETQRKERKVYALQKSKQMFSRLAKNTWLKIEIARQEGRGKSYFGKGHTKLWAIKILW